MNRIWTFSSAVGCALAMLVAAGCSCSEPTLGNPCETDRDCSEGEICDRATMVCVLDDADASVPLDGEGADAGSDRDGGAGDDGGGADSGTDAGAAECAAPADCDTLYGAAPCGSWECNGGVCEVNCPGCTDADRDGYGPEAACAGPDCDDADDTLGSDGVRSCYSGPAGTENVGTCRVGTESCVAGVLGPCTGEVFPSAEACNGQDDDCDASTDESLGQITCGVGACTATAAACVATPSPGSLGTCTPGTPAADDSSCDGIDSDCDGAVDEDCTTCVTVSDNLGDDVMAVSDGNTTPFETIQAAIDWAAGDPTRPRVVCVSQGTTCNQTDRYPGAVVMADGISVLGRYVEPAFTHCAGGNGRTIIEPGVAEGVLFPNTVSAPTTLADFDIERANTATTSAVTVDGATNVTLSRLFIITTPAAQRSYGVNLINGSAATITDVSIYGGNASMESVGVRSVGSTPTVVDNCDTVDPTSLRCDDFCGAGRNVGIRGSFGPTAAGDAFGILLEDSPGARIERSAICGNNADNGATVRIRGDATGTLIRGNLINAWGGAVDSHAVWMTSCAGAAPWIVDNEWIAAAGDTNMTRVDGVRAIGDCHPVIDSNVRITGGGEGGTSGANGVHCGVDPTSGVASDCVVLGNLLIEGSAFGFPPTAVGVRCDDGGCLRIADNVIDGRGGVETWGVILESTGTFVDDNEIRAGCASSRSIGVQAIDAWARLQNNVIGGGRCNAGAVAATEYTGIWVSLAAGPNELDVHSNTVDGQGLTTAGTSAALVLENPSGAAAVSSGTYRNNILRAGSCPTRYGVLESSAGADPRVFESNNLDPTGGSAGMPQPTALYRDEDATDLTDPTMVDGLTDMTVSGTLSVDSMFVGPADYHIQSGSMCVDMGTTTGAPLLDMDDAARDATPDIGADEI